MSTLYGKGLKFNNSKLGIFLLLISSSIILAIAIASLIKMSGGRDVPYVLSGIFLLMAATSGIKTALSRLKRLREK